MAHDKRNRDKILQAAAGLFHRHGFQPTSLEEILGKSGVSRSNFYYHFRSKEDLGFAVLAWQVERFDADVICGVLENEALEAREKLERLFRVVTDGLRAAAYRNGCPFGNLAAELSGVHPEFRNRLSAFFRRWEQAVERCVRDGVARGEFRSDVAARRLATALVSQIEGAVLLTKTHGDGEPIEAGAQAMLTLLESR
jgi:TetR/AcrR family transcriptional regulator, transcriptional repressor for nem operon